MPAPWEKYAEQTAVAEPGPWNKYAEAGPWNKYAEAGPWTKYEEQPRPAAEVQADNDLMRGMMSEAAASNAPLFRRNALSRDVEAAQGTVDLIGHIEDRTARVASNPVAGIVGPVVGGAAEEGLSAPVINLPRAGQQETLPRQAGAAIYNAGAELLAAFSSPGAVAILPAAANKGVLTAWVSGMAAHAPERLAHAHELYKAGDTQGAMQEVASTAAELGMAELGRRHVMPKEITKADVNGPPRLQVNERGEVVDTPDLARRDRSIGITEALRPYERRDWVSPLEGREKPEVVFERVPIFNRAGEVVEVKVQPRIREIVFEDPQVIVPETRFLKPDVEGGMLPERRQGFERTAEDFIEGRETPPPREEVIPNAQRQEEGRQTLLDAAMPERPAPTIQEPNSPPAESRVQPVSAPAAPTPEAARPVETPAVLTPAKDSGTVPKASASETITRPGKPGNEGTASEILAEREKRSKPTPFAGERPWDIIDEIQGEVGGTIDPKLIRELNPNWKPNGAARKLFRVGGRAADVVLNALTFRGPRLGLTKDMGLQEFGDAINAAASARQGWRSRGAAERKQLDEMGREAQVRGQFEQKVILGERPKSQQKNVETVRVDNLVVGDRFKVQEHKFEITEMLTDEDGNLTSVTLKDGPKFGVQTVGDVGQIHIDKGTLRRNRKARDVWSIPEEPASVTPVPEAPTLKSGQRQGDLLGSGDVDFNLYGERGSDGARIAAERAQAEATRQAAKEFEAKHQPGLISGTAAEAWADRTIAEGRKRINTGLDPELFSAYVVKGAAHLERGVRKFSDWARKMIAEHGEPIRPHLRRIFEEAQRGLAKTTVDRDTLKQRKLAARGSVSRDVAPEHRERLKTGKESFYEPQDVGRVEDVVSKMTSEELGSVPLVQADGPQNIGIAAKLETYRRLVAADQLDAAWRVIDETMKLGTSLGQLVNQFKLLRGATPDGVMVILNRGLKEQGFDPVTPGESMRVRRLAEESIKANAKWKEAERQWKEAPTDENFKRVEDLQADAIAADSILQEKLRQYQPRNLGNTLSTLFKGNLIAPISQARNVVGNTANLALRGGMRNVAVAVDAVDAMLRSRPRTRALVGVRGTKEAAKAVGRSLPEAWDVLKKGGADKDLSKAEARVGLRPLVALRDAISADILGPKRDGKTPVSQRLLMLLEGSPMGMHAAAQLRLLGAADKPFREAARARLITEHLKVTDINRRAQVRRLARDPSPVAKAELELLKSQDGYTSENVARAVKFPELFIDAKTLERIEHEAATAVFQNKNAVSSGIHRALSNASPGVRFLFDTVVPFVTTPANVIGEWLSYNPALAAFNAGRHAVRGDARLSTQAVGKFVVGSMAFLAGQWLYQKGLVSPSLALSDEQQKARILSGQTMPASRLNVSGLQRALAGEDATWREGDDTRDILGAGGVLGAVFQTVTDVNRRLEREPEDPSMMKKAEAFGANYALLTAGYGVNQSFLKGTATLLEGLTDPAKTESWVATYLDGLSAIALPNTLNAISRATRQNKPELRGDSLDERLNNQIKARISGVQRLAGQPGADADLPLKRDLWGRPIPETPPGSNAYLAHFLDVTKSSRIPTDPVAAHIYSLWRRTADAAVIPTPPDANFSIMGKRFDPLTRAQVSRLQELVGEERRGLAERIVDNPRFYSAPAESQIAVLKRIWGMGNKVGSFKFYRENSDTLKSRLGPAGFEPAP